MDARQLEFIRRHIRFFALILALQLIHVSPAQSPAMLHFAIPVQGQIEPGQSQEWTFTSLNTGMISLIAEAQTEGLDPIVEVLNQKGETIIRNDDLLYPDHLDAVIEGFTIPDTGAYIVKVSGYEDTEGAFTLTMLPGYSYIHTHETFENGSVWLPVETDTETIVSSLGDRMNVEAVGNNAFGLVRSDFRTPENFYIHAEINTISGNPQWHTGIVFRQQDDHNFYLMRVDNRGFWQFSVYIDGQQTILRDWQRHPAIPSSGNAFSIAVLANTSTFEVFAEGQSIGIIEDTTFLQNGGAGLAVGSLNPANSRTSITFDRVIITIPRQLDHRPLFPQEIVIDRGPTLMKGLWRRNLVPHNGVLVMNISEIPTRASRPGVHQFPISGREFTNLAIGTIIQWKPFIGSMSGCGLTVRSSNENNYVLAFVDHIGGFGLAQNKEGIFQPGIYDENPRIGQEAQHHLLVIAYEDQIHYYLNGQHVGSIRDEPRAGGIASSLINFEPVDISCVFQDTWIWTWDTSP